MPSINYRHMTVDEKYDLVDAILASIKSEDTQLTAAQESEIIHRLATLDEDIKEGQDGYEVLTELRARHRG